MTLVFDSGRQNTPSTHVLAIGIGRYPHLLGGDDGKLAAKPLGLKQLDSPPVSVRALGRMVFGSDHWSGHNWIFEFRSTNRYPSRPSLVQTASYSRDTEWGYRSRNCNQGTHRIGICLLASFSEEQRREHRRLLLFVGMGLWFQITTY